MKKKLIKILFLSLFFSVVIPTVMNAAEQESDRKTARELRIRVVGAPDGLMNFRLLPHFQRKREVQQDYSYCNFQPSASLQLQNILKLCPKAVIATAKQQGNSTAEKPSSHYRIDHPQDLQSLQEFTKLLNKARRDDLENEIDKTALTVTEFHRLQYVFYKALYPKIFQALINSANDYEKIEFDILCNLPTLINSANEPEKMDGDILYNHFKEVIDKLSPQDISGDKIYLEINLISHSIMNEF